jgi:hypothetical protein
MKSQDATVESFHLSDPETIQEAAARVQGILEAKYTAANLRDICNKSMHLDVSQPEQLFAVLSKYEALFDGLLGTWKEHPHEINLKPDSKPYHAKAFPIPKIHLETLKSKVQCLWDLGVLHKVNRLECAAPTFIIPKKDGEYYKRLTIQNGWHPHSIFPKKDGSVRFILDFREINKQIPRKPYPIL